MAGILFDLHHVIERARSNLQQAGVEQRCQLVAGSFFESVPEGADAYLMRHIIHDWSDEESVKILQNCHEHVSETGRVLIVEAIVPEGNDPSPAKEMDMAMLLYPGGMERTKTEYQALLNSAGSELAGVIRRPRWSASSKDDPPHKRRSSKLIDNQQRIGHFPRCQSVDDRRLRLSARHEHPRDTRTAAPAGFGHNARRGRL